MWTTVVGNYPKIPNLPREARLRKAITSFDRRKISREDLNRIEDEVTEEVIGEQVEAGIDIVTDGHIRWDDAQTRIARGLEGFSLTGLIRYFDTNTYYRQPVVEAPIRWKEPILLRDLRFAIDLSPKPVKATLTGPLTLARLSLDQHYKDLQPLVIDLAKALNEEAKILEGGGATIVQFDEPSLVRMKEDLPLFLDAAPHLLEGLKGTKALTTYFGDMEGILDAVKGIGFDILGLDMTTSDKNWHLLEENSIPVGIAGGIIDARNTRLETPEEVERRVRRLLEKVPSERLYLNPSAGLEFLPRERAQEKLRNLVQGVRKASDGG